MSNTHLPFYKVVLGILCGFLCVGSAMMLLGQIFVPDSFAGNFITSLLSVFVFGYFTLLCFTGKKSAEKKSRSHFSKHKLYIWLCRIFVFILIVSITTAISVIIDLPTAPKPGSNVHYTPSTLASFISFIGIILAGIMAYYLPVPKKWRSENNSAENHNSTETRTNKLSDSDEIVYEIEKVDI